MGGYGRGVYTTFSFTQADKHAPATVLGIEESPSGEPRADNDKATKFVFLVAVPWKAGRRVLAKWGKTKKKTTGKRKCTYLEFKSAKKSKAAASRLAKKRKHSHEHEHDLSVARQTWVEEAEGLLWEVPAIAAGPGLIQIGRPLCERCRAHRPGQRRTCPGCHRRVGPGCAAPEGPCWDADAGRCVDCVPVPAGGIRALPA